MVEVRHGGQGLDETQASGFSYWQVGGEALFFLLAEDTLGTSKPVLTGRRHPLFSPCCPPLPLPFLLPSLSWGKAPCILTLQSLGSLLSSSTRDGPGKLGST